MTEKGVKKYGLLDTLIIQTFGEKNLLTARSGLYTLGVILFLVNVVYFMTCFQKVPSESMDPTIEIGDIVFTNKYEPLFYYDDVDYDRGDIISFCYEGTNILGLGYCTSETYVKRIVALPGETVSFIEGDAYINDKKVELDGEIRKDAIYMDEIKLGDDEYFVVGDNRDNSMDSREFGPVKYESILGKTKVVKR